jgi:hypothetical protein
MVISTYATLKLTNSTRLLHLSANRLLADRAAIETLTVEGDSHRCDRRESGALGWIRRA